MKSIKRLAIAICLVLSIILVSLTFCLWWWKQYTVITQGHGTILMRTDGDEAEYKFVSTGKHMLKAKNYKILRDRSFIEWNRVSCVQNMI